MKRVDVVLWTIWLRPGLILSIPAFEKAKCLECEDSFHEQAGSQCSHVTAVNAVLTYSSSLATDGVGSLDQLVGQIYCISHCKSKSVDSSELVAIFTKIIIKEKSSKGVGKEKDTLKHEVNELQPTHEKEEKDALDCVNPHPTSNAQHSRSRKCAPFD